MLVTFSGVKPIDACLLFNWVWIEEVTPDIYPSSVEVTVDTSTFPLPLLINALSFVRFDEVIVVAAPFIVACLLLNVVQSVDDKYPFVEPSAFEIENAPVPLL